MRNRKVRNGGLVPGKIENAFLKQNLYTLSKKSQNYLSKSYSPQNVMWIMQANKSATA